jgi:hypothetical protein
MTPRRLDAPSAQRTRAAAHLVARRLADMLLEDPHLPHEAIGPVVEQLRRYGAQLEQQAETVPALALRLWPGAADVDAP